MEVMVMMYDRNLNIDNGFGVCFDIGQWTHKLNHNIWPRCILYTF